MDFFFQLSSIILLALIFLVFLRIIKGPTVIDRLLCVNVIGTKSIVILLLIGILFHRLDMFVDIALGYGLVKLYYIHSCFKILSTQQTLHPESQWKEETTQL